MKKIVFSTTICIFLITFIAGISIVFGAANDAATKPIIENKINQFENIKKIIRQIDTLYEKGVQHNYQQSGMLIIKISLDLCQKALKTYPDDYEILWRFSRSCSQYAETAVILNREDWKEIGKKWGEQGIISADKAQTIEPERVEAYFWQVVSIGKYNNAVGVWNAMKKGFLPKIQHSIKKSYEIDKTYLDYSPVWSSFLINWSLPKMFKRDDKAYAFFKEFESNTSWSFEPYVRYPKAAEYLMSLDDKNARAGARKLLNLALSDPNPRKYYYDRAKKMIDKVEH